jgi:hypothetical protein
MRAGRKGSNGCSEAKFVVVVPREGLLRMYTRCTKGWISGLEIAGISSVEREEMQSWCDRARPGDTWFPADDIWVMNKCVRVGVVCVG